MRQLGCSPDRPDARDHLLALTVTHLPPSVDLTSKCPPVQDQGQLGSCTANAIGAALRFCDMKEGKDPGSPISRLFIYYNERVMENTVQSDAGAMIRDGIKSVGHQGACLETEWPYEITQFATKPSAACFTDATKWEALSYKRVARTLAQLKGCLAAGNPIVIGFTVYSSFMTDAVAKSGIMPMSAPSESVEGGHAVLCVGYDGKGNFILRNSWGTDWGLKGYFLMPEAYLLDPHLSSDFWSITTASG